MSAVTILQLSRDDLAVMLDHAIDRAVAQAAEASRETWTASDLARHYGVCPRTIATWSKQPGRLPPKHGLRWLRSDVMRWDRDRQEVRKNSE
jgi:hypothetical protein